MKTASHLFNKCKSSFVVNINSRLLLFKCRKYNSLRQVCLVCLYSNSRSTSFRFCGTCDKTFARALFNDVGTLLFWFPQYSASTIATYTRCTYTRHTRYTPVAFNILLHFIHHMLNIVSSFIWKMRVNSYMIYIDNKVNIIQIKIIYYQPGSAIR